MIKHSMRVNICAAWCLGISSFCGAVQSTDITKVLKIDATWRFTRPGFDDSGNATDSELFAEHWRLTKNKGGFFVLSSRRADIQVSLEGLSKEQVTVLTSDSSAALIIKIWEHDLRELVGRRFDTYLEGNQKRLVTLHLVRKPQQKTTQWTWKTGEQLSLSLSVMKPSDSQR
jgi:hypothetical protein